MSIPQYFLKTVMHDTSSTMELDSNNCVVGLMVLVKSWEWRRVRCLGNAYVNLMPCQRAKQHAKELFPKEEGKDAVQDGKCPAVSSFLVQRYELCLPGGAFRCPPLYFFFHLCFFLLPGSVGYRASFSLCFHGSIIVWGKAKLWRRCVIYVHEWAVFLQLYEYSVVKLCFTK